MNISDEQLEELNGFVADIGLMALMRKNMEFVQHAESLIHILETYRDMPKTADGVRVKPGQKVWVITADDGIQEDEITSELCLYNAHPIDKTFSTREAAEAAKASGK